MAEIAKAAGTENQVVGKVFILYGTVKAIAQDGTERILAPNNPVYADERIITGSDGSVSIQFDGPPVTQLDLGRMTEIVIDQDVYAGVTPEVVSEAAAEAEQVQQSLLEGDQPIELEATAAGGTTGAGGGHPVVNFALDGGEVTPGSGADTTGINSTTVDTLGGVFDVAPSPIEDLGTPTGGVTVAETLDDEGLSGGIPGGDGDAAGELTTTTGTLPHDFGPDGAGSISFASMDGTTGELGSEEVSYSWDAEANTLTASSERGEIFTVVVDPATGAYTLELQLPVMHEPSGGENDAMADLTYTVTDADGDTATGTLTINIDDDTPVLLGSETHSEGPVVPGESVPVVHAYDGIPGPGEGGNTLVNTLGGDHGFGENYLPANDDGSTGFINVSGPDGIFPDGMKLFGQTYDGFYINNNGNITFHNALGTYTPFAITGDTSNPMIAPFFADVDTRGAHDANVSGGGTSTGTNLVWYDMDHTNGVITITWDDVGYYGSHTDHVNAFQLRIFNQGDQNFSFEFRYENLDWTTGDASGGSGGLGGTVAHAGWTAGDGVNYYELPQSGDQGEMLALETTSNPGTTEDGNWVFNVVGGEITIDGSSDTVTVEDEKADGGIDEDDGGVAFVNGTIVDNVNWGADGFGSATTVSVGGEDFTIDPVLGATVYWSQEGTLLGTESEGAAASLLVNGDGTYTYTLLDNLLLGQDTPDEQIDVLSTVSITGQDADGDTVTVNVTLQVQDDMPVAMDESVTQTTDSESVVIDINDQFGADGGDVAIISQAGKGEVIYNAENGQFTYTPNEGAEGTDSFTYTITDGDGDTATATVNVTLQADSEPTAVVDFGPVVEDDATQAAITGNVLDNDIAGADGPAAFVAWGDSPADQAAQAELANYGTLALNSDGTYSFTLDNSLPAVQALTAQDTITQELNYSMEDADHDTGTATLTITITGADDSAHVTVAIDGVDSTVYESGLTSVSDTSETGGGLFAVSATDGIATVTVGGVEFTLAQLQGLSSTTPSAGIDTGEGTLVLTGYSGNASDGTVSYTYTLDSAQDHVQPEHDTTLTDTVTVTVNGVGGTTDSADLTINIMDDVPTAVNIDANQHLSGANTNLMIILDDSGSMADWAYDRQGNLIQDSQGHDMTKLDVAKESIGQLFAAYDVQGDVMVKLVAFNSSASEVGDTGNWMTIDQATTALASLQAGGNTNYDVALSTAMSAFGDPGNIDGAQNVSYFLSDGEPNRPSGHAGIDGYGDGNSDVSVSEWSSFVDNNNIVSFALGMGSGSNQSALNPIAYNGLTPADTNAIVVNEWSDLGNVLVNTLHSLPVSGDLGSFGADGGHVESITLDSHTYTYNPAVEGSIGVTGADNIGHGTFDTATNTLTVTSDDGKGQIAVDMDDGKFIYTPPETIPEGGVEETIGFTLIDGDGDTASAQLNMLIDVPDDDLPSA